MRHRSTTLWLILALAIAGCAPKRPVLYPNERLQTDGPGVAQATIEACVQEAEAYSAGPGIGGVAATTAVGAGVGAAVGAAAGAAGGRAYGGAGGGAAAGAAGGAVASFIGAMFKSRDPTPVQIGYVNRCLSDQGYDVIGWQ